MTNPPKPGAPLPLRAQRALVREARGAPENLGRIVSLRVSDEVYAQVGRAGVHMTVQVGRGFSASDALRTLLLLGLKAYHEQHPELKEEIPTL